MTMKKEERQAQYIMHFFFFFHSVPAVVFLKSFTSFIHFKSSLDKLFLLFQPHFAEVLLPLTHVLSLLLIMDSLPYTEIDFHENKVN